MASDISQTHISHVEEISKLKARITYLEGKPSGYETLGNLYQEAKQKEREARKQYDELKKEYCELKKEHEDLKNKVENLEEDRKTARSGDSTNNGYWENHTPNRQRLLNHTPNDMGHYAEEKQGTRPSGQLGQSGLTGQVNKGPGQVNTDPGQVNGEPVGISRPFWHDVEPTRESGMSACMFLPTHHNLRQVSPIGEACGPPEDTFTQPRNMSGSAQFCGPPEEAFGHEEHTSGQLSGSSGRRENAGSLVQGALNAELKREPKLACGSDNICTWTDAGNRCMPTDAWTRKYHQLTGPASKGDGSFQFGFNLAGTTENNSPAGTESTTTENENPKVAREKGTQTDANNAMERIHAGPGPHAGQGTKNGIKSPAGSESSSGSKSWNSSFSRISNSNSSRSNRTHREDSTQAFGSYNFVPDVGGYTMDKHDNEIGRNNQGASESRSAGTPSSAASSFSVISDPNSSYRMSAANTSAVFDDPLLSASSANSSSTPVDAREWGGDHLSGPPANKNINNIQKRKQQASEDEKKAQDTSEDINEVQHARETAKKCDKPDKKHVFTSLTQLEMPAIEGEDTEESSKHGKHQMSLEKQEGSSMGMKAEIEEPVEEEEANETITNEPDLVDENAHLKEKGSPHSDAKLEMEDRSESTLKKTANCEMQLEEPMDKSQGEPLEEPLEELLYEELLEDVEESAATHESAPQTIASMMNSNLLQQSEQVEMSSSVNVEETKNALLSVLGGGELGPPTTELAVEISHYVVKVVKMETDNQAMKVTIDNISSELRKKESELRKKECELREKESELSQKEAFIQQLLKERDPEQKKEGRGAEEGGVARGIDGGASGGEEKGGEAKLELSEAAGGASEAGGAGGAGGHDQPKLMVKSQLQESQEWIAVENINTFRQELTAKDKEINDMKKAIEKKDKRLAKLLEANTAWDKHCTQQERDHKQQVRQVQQEKLQVQDVLQQMKQDNTSLLNQLQEAQMLAARRQRQRDELRSQVSELEARVQELEQRASQLQEVISALNSDARSLRMNSLSQTTPSKGGQGLQHMSKNELITMIEVLQQQVTVCAEDFEREREDRARAQAEKDELTAQLRTVNQVLQRADRTVEEIGREKETLQRLLEQKTAEHRELERRFNALTEERRGGHAGAEDRAGPTAPPHPPPPGYTAPPPPPPPGYIDEAPPSYHTMYNSGARNPMLPPITPPPVAGGGGRRAGNNRQPAPAAIEAAPGPPWQCSTCTYVNVPRLRICEMCEMPRNNDVV